MKYSQFEGLVIGTGGLAILATVVLAFQPRPDWPEMTAQVLLFVVLVAAAHWGRRGGLIAALGATIVYLAARIPGVLQVGLETAVLELVLLRAATYGLVGVLGGEVCGRVKYLFARFEDSCSVDEQSRVYNQRFIAQLVRTNLGTAARYGTDFSIAIVSVAPSVTEGMRPARAARVVRAVADHLRNDVRLVDDVGRLDDGRFVLVFPQTPRSGADVAAARVRAGVRDVIGARDESVSATVLASKEDGDALRAFAEAIAPPAEPETAQAADRRAAPAS